MAARKKTPKKAPAAPAKPPVARPTVDPAREAWLKEVRERVGMNVAMEDLYTGAKYPMPSKLDIDDPGSRADHVKNRLSAAAVIVIERRLKRLSMTIPGSPEAQALESDILDRAGFTRKPQTNIVSTGPVLFIDGAEGAAKMRAVYEKQKVAGATQIDGEVRAVLPVVEKGDLSDEKEAAGEARDEAVPRGDGDPGEPRAE